MKHILFYNIPKSINNNQKFNDWLYERVCNYSKISVKIIENDKELDEEYEDLKNENR